MIGAGNILMRDDGVGIKVVKRLEAQSFDVPVEFLDAGTAIQDVLPQVADAQTAVIVDALQADEAPGCVFKLTPEDLHEDMGKRRLSLHQVSLLESIQLAKLSGSRVPAITIFGVVPAHVDWGLGLSAVLEGRMDEIVQTIYDEIRRICDNIRKAHAADAVSSAT